MKYVRDLRCDAKALTVLHFIQSITLIFDGLNSSNLVWASYTLLQTQYLLFQEKAIYSLNLFESFVGFTFRPLSTNILTDNVPIQITIGELKKIKCIKSIISSIMAFMPCLFSKLNQLLNEMLQESFEADKYSVAVVSYCLISDRPPIARVLYESSTKVIQHQSMSYIETKSNDLQTLFKFMETACSIITHFNEVKSFQETHITFGNYVSELPMDIDVALLAKLPPDKDMSTKLNDLQSDFEKYYDQLIHFSESSILQFLNRLNCTNLDALSFIQLTRALNEFNSFVKCNALKDWILVTARDFLTKYSSASIISIKNAVLNDSWIPTQTDSQFISLVQTLPSSTQHTKNETENTGFNFNNEYKEKALGAFASSSAMTTVRVIHSLICLSMELDTKTCLNLLVQVSIYFVSCLMNIFLNPIQIFIDNNNNSGIINLGNTPSSTNYILNPVLILLFESKFSNSVKYMFSLLGETISASNEKNSLPRSINANISLALSNSGLNFQSSQSSASSILAGSNEAQLMQMVTATEGLDLLLWYLNGIRENVLERAQAENSSFQSLNERMKMFYDYVVDIVIPGFRKNISACVMKNNGFLHLKNLKYQITSSKWDIAELTIEYHTPIIQNAKKSLEKLDKILMSLQLKRSVMNEIYAGTWSYLTQVLISAFASIRSCNGLGRSLMAADTKKIREVFLSIAKIDVDISIILEYINAFFYKVNEFSNWIDTVPGRFKQQHIVALVKTGLSINLSSNDSKNLLSKIDTKYAYAARL